jgi:hypothetical protein
MEIAGKPVISDTPISKMTTYPGLLETHWFTLIVLVLCPVGAFLTLKTIPPCSPPKVV